MMFTTKHLTAFNVTCRVLIALVGGYILASLSAVLISQLLSGDKVNNIITGLMLSFIIYTVVVLFVFSTKTMLRAALGVFVSCTVIYCFINYSIGITVL